MISIVLIICILPVFAQQPVPKDVDSTSAQKVQQEHEATRKFISSEIARQKTDFYKQFDDRGKYYENQFTKIINGIMLKLALIWIGIVIFSSAFNKFLSNRMEKRKYQKLKEALLKEVKGGDITHEDNPIPITPPKPPIEPQMTPEQWIQQKQQQIMKDQEQLLDVMKKMDTTKGVTNR